jgi:7-keto-8-aminopelargonate synthetase-like enzyme
MKTGFENMGYDTGPTQTPIIPIMIGYDEMTFLLWKLLRESGVFCNPVIFPAVPKNQALIRTSYSASHTDEELDMVLNAFEQCGKQLGLIQ